MKEYHRNLASESEKKANEIIYQNDKCDCFVGFLKLHQYSCPLVRKTCPIHGNTKDCNFKEEKMGCHKCMIISLHSTGNLFHSAKTSRSHESRKPKNDCSAGEYLSMEEPVKTGNGGKRHETQTNAEESKNYLPQNEFVKKTKSFVVDKTNRIRKLKQCFHSPCNSIIQKCSSQTSLREKPKVFLEVKKTRNVSTCTVVKLNDRFLEPSNPWDYHIQPDKPHHEKSREHDKKYSNLDTITNNNQETDSSIIEIRHKKGLMEIPKTKKKSSFFAPFVYYASVDNIKNEKIHPDAESRTSELEEKFENPFNYPISPSTNEPEETSSEKSLSESSGSVFFTPFILQPAYTDRSEESDIGNQPKYDTFERKTLLDNTTQTEDPESKERESLNKAPSQIFNIKTKERSTSMGSSMKSNSIESKLLSPITSEHKSQDTQKEEKNYEIILEQIRKSSIFSEQVPDEEVQPEPSLLNYQNEVPKVKKLNEIKNISESPAEIFLEKKYREVQTGPSLSEITVPEKEFKIASTETKFSQTDPKSFRDIETEPIQSEINSNIFMTKSVQTTMSDGTTYQSFSIKEKFVKSFIESDSETLDKQQPKCGSDGELYCKKVHACSDPCDCSVGSLSEESKFFHETKIMNKECNKITKDKNKYCESTSQTIKVLTKDEGNNTSLADLSELTKIINKVFDKMSNEAIETCDSQKPSEQGVPKKPGKPSDITGNLQYKQKVTAGTQIDYPENYVIYICKKCSKKMTFVNQHTSTDPEPSRRKEKITLGEGYSETIKIQTVKKITECEKLPVPKINAVDKKKPEESVKKENISALPHKSDTSSWAKQGGVQRTPSALRHPFHNTTGKVVGQNPQTSTQEKKKPDNTPKSSPVQNRKTTTPSRNTTNQNPAPKMNKEQLRTCECETKVALSVKTNSRIPITNQKPIPSSSLRTDLHPSIPAQPRPGTSESGRPTIKPNTAGRQKKTDLTYTVTYRPVWPKELMKTLQGNVKNFKEDTSYTSKTDSTVFKTKRNHQSDYEEDIPTEKKIRAEKIDESGCDEHQQTQNECFVFEGTKQNCYSADSQLKLLCKHIPPKKKETIGLSKHSGFVWTPHASSIQIDDSHNQSKKVLKSEGTLNEKNITKQKIKNSNLCKLIKDKNLQKMSAETFDRLEATTNLFRCTFCKSLTYRKVDWNNTTENDILELRSYPLQGTNSYFEPTKQFSFLQLPRQTASDNITNNLKNVEECELTSSESLLVLDSVGSVLEEDKTENTEWGFNQYITSDTEEIENESNTFTWKAENCISEPEEVIDSTHPNRISAITGSNFHSKVLHIWKKKSERKGK